MQLIRVLGMIRSSDVRTALQEALAREEGYELELAPGDERSTGNAARGADVVILELPAEQEGSLDAVEKVRARAGAVPVIAVAPDDENRYGNRAIQHGCADALGRGSLYPEVIQRSVRHAVELARAERRREQAERGLAESEQRYRSLFEQSRDALFIAGREGEVVEMNPAALRLLSYASDDPVGRDLGALFADPGERERFDRELETRGEVRDLEVRLVAQGSEERTCLISAWARRGAGSEVTAYQGIIHDITERRSVEDRLVHEAFHDSLTGLPNRALFMDRLERAVARRRRGEERDLAVLFLDMDRFKVINDSMGHLAGDEMLRRIGRMLGEEVREEDTVARIGGDEFAILLDGVDDPSDPTHVAERIQTRLRAPLRIHGQDVFTSLSIGIVLGGRDVESPEALLRSADTAMYRAKELGPARYQIYDEDMHTHAVTLLQMETDLRLAIERNQFVLHYQPLVRLSDDAISGFEALVRWDHPEQGLLQPQSFIPIAEDTGLMIPLGHWVLREAIRQLREWRLDDPSFGSLFVSVNLSGRQFMAPDLTGTVAGILDEEGVEASSLRLEIPESAMMRDPVQALETLRRLREMGITLCIDDFGTGYSSLSTLHRLPVDIIKIDRSFIARLEEESEGRVVETILSLARNMGMDAVAEGVETEAQLGRLRSLGSSTAQGFYFSTPVDAEAAGKLLVRPEAETRLAE